MRATLPIDDPAVTDAASTPQPTRRDFLYVATVGVGAVGALATLVPLFDQMSPDRATIAAGAPISVDIGNIAPGQQIQVFWRGRPVFIINRPAAMLKILQKPELTRRLSDPQSEVNQQPPYAKNWHRSVKPEYAVLVGICTHLGCIPMFYPSPSSNTPASDWLGGYFCPCHGSKYDLAGRVFSGVPAPYNLPVPPYRFVDDKTLRIGENPPDVDFDFGSIVQV
jgi:ubiquinol-cytochrome c reductase iron-sulfur subunit